MATISPTIPASGQSRATEELDVSSALTTIVNAINGGLDQANIADGGVGAAELATDAKNLFLQLAAMVAGNRKISFGTGSIDFSSLGVNDSTSIAHGLGSAPVWVGAFQDFRTVHGDQSAASFGWRSADSTNLVIRGRLVATAYAFNINVAFVWVAIG